MARLQFQVIKIRRTGYDKVSTIEARLFRVDKISVKIRCHCQLKSKLITQTCAFTIETHTEFLVDTRTSEKSLPGWFTILIPHKCWNWRISWRSVGNPCDRKVSQEGKAIVLRYKTAGCKILE